jgi:nucleolar GTP-binding protein
MAQSSGFFKSIEPVPYGSDFLGPQPHTATSPDSHPPLLCIRSFYSRKVKYTQESFTEKWDGVLRQFLWLDTVHPFHADLVCLLKEIGGA